MDNILLEDINLSNRTKNALKRHGVFNTETLMNLTFDEITKMRNVGLKSAQEILELQEKIKDNKIEFRKIERNDIESPRDRCIIEIIFPKLEVNKNTKVFYIDIDGLLYEDLLIKMSDFSVRTFNALKRENINSLNQLAFTKMSTIIEMRNLGKKSIEEIINYLKNKSVINLSCELEDNVFNKIFDVIKINDEQYNDKIKKAIELFFYTNMHEINETLKTLPIDELMDNKKIKELICNSKDIERTYKTFLLSEIKNSKFNDFEKKENYLTDIGLTKKVIEQLIDEKKIESIDGTYKIREMDIDDWISSLEPKIAEIITMRLQGCTLQECGKKIGVSRERVRQMQAKALRRKTLTKEDEYAYWFEKYLFLKEEFIELFKETERVYYYLCLKYKKGVTDIEEIQKDEKSTNDIRKAVKKYINKNKICIYEEYVPCRRDIVLRKFLEHEAVNEEKIPELYKKYLDFLLDENLYQNKQLLFSCERAFEARVEEVEYILTKLGRKARYYPIEEININLLIKKLSLKQYKNVEISTYKIFNEKIEIMDEFDIRDEYELHNLLKKTEKKWNNRNKYEITFSRMPNLKFGKADRQKQVVNLLLRVAPISQEKFAELYEKEYGVIRNVVVANYIPYISQYYNNGKCIVNYSSLDKEEEIYMKKVLDKDFYFIEEIKKEFVNEFGESKIEKINPHSLKQLNFIWHSNYTISTKYSTVGEYFEKIILENDIFDLTKQDSRIKGIQQFNAVLNKLKKTFSIFEYDVDKYISFDRLHRTYPQITKNIIKNYVNSVENYVEEGDFFTIENLKQKGFNHELEMVGLKNHFFCEILRQSPKFKGFRTKENFVFYKGRRQVTIVDFIKKIMIEKKKMNIFDFINYVQNEYGINLKKVTIVEKIKVSSMYYDSIMQKIYYLKDYYYDELREMETL